MRRAFHFLAAAFAGSTLVVALVVALTALPAGAEKSTTPPVYTELVKNAAVGGYDPVSYFTADRPVAGSDTIALEHDGATWRFATEENRAAFRADPTRYAPQFGGYCAFAVAQGYTAKGDPHAWKIVGGKLYLNYDKAVQATWEKDAKELITKAEANWPKIISR